MSFASDIEKWVKKADLKMDQAVRGVRHQVVVEVIKKFPVDTGQARGSVFAKLGSPGDSPKILDGNEASALARAQPAINGKIDTIFYFTSNLPYIGLLENGGYSQGKYSTSKTTARGYSSQAPHGMFKISAIQIRRKIRKIVK